ncbi:MAG TPA: hypothetical protein VLB87_13850 [Pyrinomonadaceae bacterium]|nr:hypothetical protein [Pyrinomonadaceae bacterium]
MNLNEKKFQRFSNRVTLHVTNRRALQKRISEEPTDNAEGVAHQPWNAFGV